MEQALEALNLINHRGNTDDELLKVGQVIIWIQERLAEDDDEPVGYITYIEDAGILFTQDEPEHGVYEPVYARPQTKKNS